MHDLFHNLVDFFFNLNTIETFLKSKSYFYLSKIKQIIPNFAAGPQGNKGCLFYAFFILA